MKKFILTAIMICVTMVINAATLTGNGVGETEDNAKNQALQDLSMKIAVEVKSRIVDFTEEGGVNKTSDSAEYSANIVDVKSEMPVLGAKFDTAVKQSNSGKRIYTCTATLDTDTSLPLYEKALAQLADKINSNIEAAEKKKNTKAKTDILNNALTDLEQYNKYATTAIFLGITNPPKPSMTEAEIIARIKEIQKKADTIDYAGQVLGGKLKNYKNIYLYPIKPTGSNEITPLSVAIRDNIQKYAGYTTKLDAATYILRGKYSMINDGKSGISIICYVSDRSNNNLKTVTIDLTPESYADIDYQPKTTDFDKLLHEGFVVSNDFNAQLSTSKGREDLLFDSSETVKILLKLNRAGYYYIVGYVYKDDEKFAYLLELNDGTGNRKFVNYINQDDANKWIELGEFTVEPPYGVESLQIIASTADITTVPAAAYDQGSGYYIIGGTATEAVKATRGLKPKKTDEVFSAEDVLMFTTSK
ncbi:MAG: hypothetical protein II707_10200 [Spirochaetales bacterium]|nr:hypothetical protein [Spirochaetales bacterium]